MKRNILILGSVMLLFTATSCWTTEKTLYNWSNYEDASYKYSKEPSEKSQTELEECFAKMTENQKSIRNTLPPGILAEQAFLMVKKGKKDEAIALLKKEMKLYPESKPFIEKIIKQLEK